MSFIKNIAIIGGSGQLGTPLLKALVESGKFNLTAITRDGSSSKFPSSVRVLRGDYSSPTFLSSSLHNQEALIIILSTTAPKDLQAIIITTAIAASVTYILPTEFGPDTANPKMTDTVPFLPPKKQFRDQIAASKSSNFIAVINGLWFDTSLAGGFFGIDILARTARFYDDGNTPFSSTTLTQVGHGITALFSLPLSKLEKFKNSFVYINSFNTSQKQILASVQKATGTSMEEWVVSNVSVDEAIGKGMAEFKAGNYKGLLDVLFGNNSKRGMGGDFEGKLSNALLGLEGEELDVVVMRVVEGVQSVNNE